VPDCVTNESATVCGAVATRSAAAATTSFRM